MILIADSGATKTHWYFCHEPGDMVMVQTEGINAATMGRDKIHEIVLSAASKAASDVINGVEAIYFYGAGIVSSEASSVIRAELCLAFPSASLMEFHSDMTGAATALFGNGRGVAAIMGTGSNSCLYENGKIIRNIRPGGFILGDEGSGAALGREFLSDYFKELVPAELAAEFDEEFHVTYPEAVANIYKGDAPSRYLASFAKFIVSHKSHEYVAGLIERNLRNFIERALSRYGCTEAGVVGSLGYALQDELSALGREYGLNFVKFLSSPIHALAAWHTSRPTEQNTTISSRPTEQNTPMSSRPTEQNTPMSSRPSEQNTTMSSRPSEARGEI